MFLGSGAPCHWHEQQRFWFLLGELPTPLGDLGGWGRAFLVLKRQALFLRPSGHENLCDSRESRLPQGRARCGPYVLSGTFIVPLALALR